MMFNLKKHDGFLTGMLVALWNLYFSNLELMLFY